MDGEIFVIVPFTAIFIVLLVVLLIFEVRRRRLRSQMLQGYKFVINMDGRIMARIPPGEECSYPQYMFVPVMIICIFAVSYYIRTSTRKLFEEMQRRGCLVYGFPSVVYASTIHDMHQVELRSPTTGLPPPPAYTPVSNTVFPAPPPYTAVFQSSNQP